jgi:hypothetical protein
MRIFIKTESAVLVDASSVMEIISKGSGGGVVGVRTLKTQHHDGHIVARIDPTVETDAYGTEQSTDEEKESRQVQAANIAENLLHAVCVAQDYIQGAVIHWDTENRTWTLTNLGKTATKPVLA